jgi:fimbrial isopeptide formation D2 family protein/LPXTG-motif cell wall-anchored protein
MKLIKKIAAIMFAFMMVVSMSCNVKAEGAGKITIDNAKKDETYTIYQVLTLESSDETKGLYSYTPANDAWKAYFKTTEGKKYMTVDENGYVTTHFTETNAQELAQALIKQAKTITCNSQSITANKDGAIEFKGLELGYYVVDTTVGTLCALTTTQPTATIVPKHDQPTVDKTIHDGENYVPSNSVNIGDPVKFETKIHVKKGAKNYVLHDQMSSGLTFGTIHDIFDDVSDENLKFKPAQDYQIKTEGLTDGCTFELTFNQNYFDRTNQDTTITVMYYATVNENAPIKQAMENKTWLTYGDAQKTEESKTETYTFGIPVFKYTGENIPLEGAQFILSTDSKCENDTKTLKFKLNDKNKYRYDNTSGNKVLTSLTKGRIDIEGLKEGTYYLKETKAPEGYNLLKAPVEIRIASDGKIFVGGSPTENTGDVRVQNKSGTLLPHTGGAGTTMIYLVGALLVLGSGVVLASKRRSNSK